MDWAAIVIGLITLVVIGGIIGVGIKKSKKRTMKRPRNVVDSEWEKAEDEKAERKEMTFWHTEPDHQHRGGVQPFTEAEMGKMEEQKEEERMARIMEEAEMGKRHEIEAEIRIALIKEEAEREKMKKDLE